MSHGSDFVYWIILGGLCAGFAWLLYRGRRSAGRDDELWRGWERRHRKGRPQDPPPRLPDEPPDGG